MLVFWLNGSFAPVLGLRLTGFSVGVCADLVAMMALLGVVSVGSMGA
jgi:hypothetical protein